MTVEVRHIIFTKAEITQAAIQFLQKSGRELQAGTVVNMKTEAEPDVQVSFEVLHDKDNGKSAFILNESDLFEALLSFCIDRNVPLSRTAAKTVQVIKGNLCLIMTMNMDIEKLSVIDNIKVGV